MHILLDTNLWLRYLIGDHLGHLAIVRKILELNDESKLKLAISTFVLSEIIYTEQSFYNITRGSIMEDIHAISSIKNILLVEQTNIKKTIQLFNAHKNAKWSDCIIAAQVPDNYQLCSFDTKLARIIGEKQFIAPHEVIQSFVSN